MIKFNLPSLIKITRFYSTSIQSPLELNLRIALKSSMKERNTFRTSVIKSILGDISNSAHLASPPSPIKTLSRAINIRKDSSETFLKSNRPGLSEQYLKEVEILQEFEIEQKKGETMNELELTEEVLKVMKSIGLDNLSMKDMGKVMKLVIVAVEGKADGKQVSEAVKKLIK